MGSSSSKQYTISSEIHRIYSKQLYQRFHKNNNNNNNSNNNNTKDTDICNSTNDDITDKLGIKLKQYEELEKLIRFKEKTEAINWRTKLNTYDISAKEINSVIDQLYISIESNTISTTEFLLLAYPEIKNYINNTMKCNINDNEFKLTALMMASITGNRLALELLLQNPYVNINTTSENNNNSALIFGTLYEQTISVETLCCNDRLDINHNDCNNYNALHHAVLLENVDITRIICKRKDLSLIAQTNNGDTVLHIACRNGNQQIIDIILDAVSKQTLSASSLYNGNHLWKIVSPRIDDKSSEFSDDISESTNSIISLDSDSCLSPRASIITRESLQNIAKIKNKKKETALSILLSMNDAHKFLSCSSPTKQQQYKKINVLKEKLKRLS